jgi:hypothetical protein
MLVFELHIHPTASRFVFIYLCLSPKIFLKKDISLPHKEIFKDIATL